jgi:hypothetical protein
LNFVFFVNEMVPSLFIAEETDFTDYEECNYAFLHYHLIGSLSMITKFILLQNIIINKYHIMTYETFLQKHLYIIFQVDMDINLP